MIFSYFINFKLYIYIYFNETLREKYQSEDRELLVKFNFGLFPLQKNRIITVTYRLLHPYL